MTFDKMIASPIRIGLGHVQRPSKMDHVLQGDEDALPPRHFHPIFFGSFDWHSCVHGWWTLLTLRRLHPGMMEASAIAELADSSFSPTKVVTELAYLDRPASGGFERPYGWGWLLYLHLEASRHEDRPWASELEPLARAFAERLHVYLAKLTYPIRVNPFQHCLCVDPRHGMGGAIRPGAGQGHPDLVCREIHKRPGLSGMGAGRRRVPVVGAD